MPVPPACLVVSARISMAGGWVDLFTLTDLAVAIALANQDLLGLQVRYRLAVLIDDREIENLLAFLCGCRQCGRPKGPHKSKDKSEQAGQWAGPGGEVKESSWCLVASRLKISSDRG